MTNWTKEQEAAALARCDAATKGPWGDNGYIDQLTDGGKGYPLDFYPDGKEILWHEGEGQYDCSCSVGMREEDRIFTIHARTDLPAAIEETRRLRQALIDNWTHSPLKCPCATRQLPEDVPDPAPWTECTCGLTEALYGEAAEAR